MHRTCERRRPAEHRRSPWGEAALSAVAVVAAVALFSGCATDAPAASAGSPSTVPSPTASPTPTPTPVDIREIDLGTGNVMYSSGGFSAPVWVTLEDGTASDESGTYTLAEPVYSDANGDGLEDALVAIERVDGSASETLWYVFLADGEGGAVQVAVPLARAASCGEVVESTSAAPQGGFALEVLTRIRGTDDAIPCSAPGSRRDSRVIVIDGEPGDPLAMPVQTAPAVAWGGICPGTTWWDTESEMVEMLALPRAGSPVANPATSSAGICPAAQDPAPLLSSIGVPTEEWAFVMFIGEAFAPQNVKPLTCAWASRG